MKLQNTVASPMSPEAWSEVRNLSECVAQDSGWLRLAKDADDSVAGSLYLPGNVFPGLSPDEVATGLEANYPQMLSTVNSGDNNIILNKVGADLEDGRNVVVNMNHASLVRSGIGLRVLSRALEDKKVHFEKAIIVGAALLNLEVKINSDPEVYIHSTDAMGLVGDHIFVSVPDSRRAQNMREKYKEEVGGHNAQMKGMLTEMLDSDKGVLLMMLGSGTHDRPKEDDPNTIAIETVSEGTIDFIIENRLRVVQAAVTDLPGRPMEFDLLSGPSVLETHGQMHRGMARIARHLGHKAVGVDYEYQLPELALQEAA